MPAGHSSPDYLLVMRCDGTEGESVTIVQTNYKYTTLSVHEDDGRLSEKMFRGKKKDSQVNFLKLFLIQ